MAGVEIAEWLAERMDGDQVVVCHVVGDMLCLHMVAAVGEGDLWRV